MEINNDNRHAFYAKLVKAISRGQLNIVKNFFTDVAIACEGLKDVGRELLREACMHNKLDIVKYLIEHENKQALNDFNTNYGFIFWVVIENKNWDIANYFISELNMPLSWELEWNLKGMDKDEAQKINHMFEMRGLKQSLATELPINEENKINKLKI
jgi:ankyrin repeat protein